MRTDPPPRYAVRLREAVALSGWPALYLARLLERELRDAAPSDRVRIMRRIAAELEQVGAGSEGGTVEQPVPEPAPSSRHDHVSVREAAEVLGVSCGYVRRLAREGRVAGRRTVAGWLLDGADVEAEAQARTEAA